MGKRVNNNQPVDGFLDVMDFECGHLNFTPLRRFGFRVGDGTRLFRRVGTCLSVGAAGAARLLRHLPHKFATRLRRENGFTLAPVTLRLIAMIQTLQVSIDAYRSNPKVNSERQWHWKMSVTFKDMFDTVGITSIVTRSAKILISVRTVTEGTTNGIRQT
jgi:hypothetical protein